MQSRSSRGFATVGQVGGLTSAFAGGFVGWLIGELLATRLTQWADAFQSWATSFANPSSSHFDLSGIVIGLPLALVALVFNILCLLFSFAHRFYLTTAFGALYGLFPSPFSRFFSGVARTLQGGAAVTGMSAVEVVTTKGVGNKVWALIPVVLAVMLVTFLGKAADRFRPHASPAVERFMRYQPTGSWTTSISDQNVTIELRSVELESKRLGTVIRFSNHASKSLNSTLSSSSLLRRDYEGTFAGSFTKVIDSDGQLPLDQNFAIPAHGYIEGTIYFPRPRQPFVAWRLTLWVQNSRAEFFFQLPEQGP